MPFVTEALWERCRTAPTDPELLIVARWPGVGERDLVIEEEVDARHRPDPRASATPARRPSSRAGDLAETRVSMSRSALGPTFEALRPAIERLARARPLERELTPEALEAAASRRRPVVVIAGGARGDRPAARAHDPASADLERERLERELDEAEGWLAAARARLANERFISQGARRPWSRARAAREAELAEQVERLRDRLGR